MNTFKKLLTGFLTLAVVVASAASDYKVDIGQPVQVGGTELKPGKYKVEIQGDKAVFKSGRDIVVEVPATVETGDQKYRDTRLTIAGGTKLTAVSVGGTNITIVLKP